MHLFGDPAHWLPLAFAGILGLSILIYVCLDGFDLGLGLLFPFADEDEKDRMIASIGPFWDANETWLVLAIGVLLVAFPTANSMILTTLYLPVATMLVGLILRGVAFEFRAKVLVERKPVWNIGFFAGSLLTSLSQGAMLGLYVMGLEITGLTLLFALLTAVFLTVAYSFIGATWLILKSEGPLQEKAVDWASRGLWGVVLGLGAISVASPLVSGRIYERWFSMPEILLLSPLPILSLALIAGLWLLLRRLPLDGDRLAWAPFAGAIVLFALGFFGMAYSFYPFIVPEALTIHEAASAPESLFIILLGTVAVMPMIMGYTVLAYVVFRGKATELRYD